MITKYLEDGSEVSVVAHTEWGYLVKQIWHDDELDDLFESAFTYLVDKVYDKPPTKKYHDEVVKLEKRIEGLENQIHQLRKERDQIQNQIAKSKQKKVHVNFS